jgi:hypothetical protein
MGNYGIHSALCEYALHSEILVESNQYVVYLHVWKRVLLMSVLMERE